MMTKEEKNKKPSSCDIAVMFIESMRNNGLDYDPYAALNGAVVLIKTVFYSIVETEKCNLDTANTFKATIHKSIKNHLDSAIKKLFPEEGKND